MKVRFFLFCLPLMACGTTSSPSDNHPTLPLEQDDRVSQLEQRIAHLEATILTLTRGIEVNKGDGHLHITGDVVIESGNLYVQNGTGSTAQQQNGKGNVIIGYNEEPTRDVHASPIGERTGSHNLVIGQGHTFTSHSGIVSGKENYLSANYAAIIAGQENAIRDLSGVSAPKATG
jgi:hypothetical protein